MNPKSGKKITPAKPAKVKEPVAADEADPGKVAKIKAEQAQTKKGKYGSQTVDPGESDGASKKQSSGGPAQAEEEPTSFIEVEIVDEDGQPVSGENFELKLPDGKKVSGSTDAEGAARVDSIPPGNCELTFPNMDQSVWESA